ncbi:hypothetical protein JCM8547_001721 [Rhodosporidiobolus lusitaniae]
MSSDAPRGRGRGRGKRIAAQTLSGSTIAGPSPSPAPESAAASRASTATPAPEATDDAPSGSDREAATSAAAAAAAAEGRGKSSTPAQAKAPVKRVASVGLASSRAGSVGLSRTPSIGMGAARDRPVGGLLGSTSEFRPGASGTAAGKAKFRPNMRRVQSKAAESDDEDVKMEDADDWRNRKKGPRAPRQRVEMEMTASGPMAQGPGGPPRAWGPKPTSGASGAAVMAASRAGTLNRMLDDDSDASDLEVDEDPFAEEGGVRFKAIDLNDIGTAPGEEEEMTPLVLPRDPKVLRTKIKRMKERKGERAKREAAEQAKREGRVEHGMSIDGTSTPSGSGAATPALDSKEGSLSAFDEEKEAKDLKDLEEEEAKEIILSEAFEVAPEARGELYMFQFPRKFPTFTPANPSSPSDDDENVSRDAVKADPDAPAPRRKPQPPQWGRFGTRQEKAARWSEEAGRIGELCVHKSGKVTLRLNGDLRYEVLPAAQPSFLQEIAVLDHPQPKPTRRDSSSSSSSSSSDSDSQDSSSSVDRKKKDKKKKSSSAKTKDGSSSSSKAKLPPPDSLVILGQTSKKFLVVPEVGDLLEKVAKQEKAEKDEERRIKMAKAGAAGGPVGGVKKEGRR